MAFVFSVCGFTNQRVDAALTELFQERIVGGVAEERIRIELEVGRMDHIADRCHDEQPDIVRDVVVHVEEFDREVLAQLHDIAGLDQFDVGLGDVGKFAVALHHQLLG